MDEGASRRGKPEWRDEGGINGCAALGPEQ